MTLNRPEVFNSFAPQLVAEFKAAVMEIAKDDSARVLIITGAGKAFQAGADIKEMSAMTTWEFNDYNHRLVEALGLLDEIPQPVIAAINGYALGGGLELALACDIRVASENVKMGLPEVKLGIIPGAGGTQRLIRLVPAGLALELLYTGRQIDAQEGLRLGLINKVVAKGQELTAAKELAREIMANAPLAVRQLKDSVVVGRNLPLQAAVEYTHKNVVLCAASQDAKEGMTAFLEKRSPQWKGM